MILGGSSVAVCLAMMLVPGVRCWLRWWASLRAELAESQAALAGCTGCVAPAPASTPCSWCTPSAAGRRCKPAGGSASTNTGRRFPRTQLSARMAGTTEGAISPDVGAERSWISGVPPGVAGSAGRCGQTTVGLERAGVPPRARRMKRRHKRCCRRRAARTRQLTVSGSVRVSCLGGGRVRAVELGRSRRGPPMRTTRQRVDSPAWPSSITATRCSSWTASAYRITRFWRSPGR